MNVKNNTLSTFMLMQCLSVKGITSDDFYNNVSLTWGERDNILWLNCTVFKMGLGVYLMDPKGQIRGHCSSPILSENAPGKCDPGLEQRILDNQSVENILKFKLVKCENGVWKCMHGEKTNEEDTTLVIMDLKVNCPDRTNSFWERCRCVFSPLAIGYILGYFVCKLVLHCRAICRVNQNGRSKCTCKTYLNQDCSDNIPCWQFALKKCVCIVACVLVIPFFAFIKDLCQDGMIYMLLIGIWSCLVAVLEVYISRNILSYIERRCSPNCICTLESNSNSGHGEPTSQEEPQEEHALQNIRYEVSPV